jgi:hypothetical protein
MLYRKLNGIRIKPKMPAKNKKIKNQPILTDDPSPKKFRNMIR